jgi:predicted nucleotidyltransferase
MILELSAPVPTEFFILLAGAEMKTIDDIRDFLDIFIPLASDQVDVQRIALAGSYARGAAREDSDIDLVVLTDQPGKYLGDLRWIERFGTVEKHQTEDYGKLISLRVWYQNDVEAEFGITMPDWAAIPLDAGTPQVILGGMIVLFERENLLRRHMKIGESTERSAHDSSRRHGDRRTGLFTLFFFRLLIFRIQMICA